MDFQNRSTQPQVVVPGTRPTTTTPLTSTVKKFSDKSKWGRVAIVSLVGGVVGILVAVAVIIAFGGNGANEGKYVDTSKYQAVFLQSGQVYFGKVKVLNSNYLVLSSIYYLQTSSTSATATAANSSVSLVKLGCELHQPYDQMVINRSQVTFWENLQDGGQVAKAVQAFVKSNPTGQKCTDSTSSSSTSTTVQNAGSTGIKP